MAAARPDTWMPMFWGDYFKDTNHLGKGEHGAYMLLIGHYWCTGQPLPDNDAVLARVTRQALAGWKRERPIIAPFFQIEGGLWRHGRIDHELDRATRFIEKQGENGSKGGRPKKPTETQAFHLDKPKPNSTNKPNITTSPSPSNNTLLTSNGTVAEEAALAPGGARLPDSAKWCERLDRYAPWLGKREWSSTWGPAPDSPGGSPLIPKPLLEAWQERARAGWAAARAQEGKAA